MSVDTFKVELLRYIMFSLKEKNIKLVDYQIKNIFNDEIKNIKEFTEDELIISKRRIDVAISELKKDKNSKTEINILSREKANNNSNKGFTVILYLSLFSAFISLIIYIIIFTN